MPKCPVCGDYFWTKHHVCPPAWGVYLDADGYSDDDARRIFATDPKEAACEFAAYWDNGEYGLLNGGEIDVIVFHMGCPEERFLFTVKGEVTPYYYVSDERHPSWAESDAA